VVATSLVRRLSPPASSSFVRRRAACVRFTFNAATGACSHSGLWREAVGLLRRMETYGLTPDVRSYTAAITAAERGGAQWRVALEARMGGDGVTGSRGIDREKAVVLEGSYPSCNAGRNRQAYRGPVAD
jgi:pentatricopeptide repeat protein